MKGREKGLNIEKAFRYPFSEGMDKFKIGLLFAIVPIVNFISFGYLMDYVSNVTKGNEEMPEWGDYGGYFVKGLMYFLACLVYFIIPIILLWFGLGAALLLSGVFMLLSLIGLLLLLIAAFIFPMAITNYAATGNFGSAFDFGTIFGRITSNIGSYLIAFVLSLVFGFIAKLFFGISYVGWIFGDVILFIGYTITLFLTAQIYRGA